MDLSMRKAMESAAPDAYVKEFLSLIKNAQSDEEIISIVDKIYEDGFEDGYDEGQNDSNEDSCQIITIV